MNNDAGDGMRVIETLIVSRAEFERFVEGLFAAAEAIWPTPDESEPEIETLPALPPRAADPAPAIEAGDKKSRDARIVHLVDVEKRKQAEVARAFGLSVKSVENILYRARRARRA